MLGRQNVYPLDLRLAYDSAATTDNVSGHMPNDRHLLFDNAAST